jgi:hypothetical protein
MNRNTLVGLIALFVVALGAALYYGFSPAPVKAPVDSVTTTLTNPYTEHGAYYDITAAYPTTTPLKGNAGDDAISAMQGFIITAISQFKTDGNFDHLTPEDIKAMGFDQGRKLSFAVTYQTSSSPHTVSYRYTINEDTGGAHGNTFFKTFTFDTDTGKELALADMFTPGSKYLERLSTIARSRLPIVLGEAANAQMMADGTAPQAKNFENWYLDGDVLVILFPPYAVAPYAAGPQTLPIPLSELGDTVRSEYRT